MFAGTSKVLFSKTEGGEFTKALIRAIEFAVSKGYVKALTIIFYLFVVQKSTLSRNNFNQVKEIARRIKINFPSFRHASGLYYRALHDNNFSNDARQKARFRWNARIDFDAIDAINTEWNNNTSGILEKMRDAGVEPETVAQITRYLKRNGALYVPDEYLGGPGQLRAVG